MRILILSDAGSIHTFRWVKSLSELGNVIFLFSLSGNNTKDYEGLKNVKIYSCMYQPDMINSKISILKIRYLSVFFKLRNILKEFAPEIIHAHYATSYGFLGSLLGFHPFIISVWGSDVFAFPQKSLLHKYLLKFNFWIADMILSTSYIMKNEIEKYTGKKIEVIPFGIDTGNFKPKAVKKIFNKDNFVIGIVKSLYEVYGIEYLVKAFHILKNKYPGIPLKLLIVGGGPQKYYLEELTRLLKIEKDTIFTGNISYSKIPGYHNMIDIAVYPSLQESFGVSVIESSSCEKPVIASDIGGLPETVIQNCTGLLIEPKDVTGIVLALEKLIFNEEERIRMGKNGRMHVKNNYEWESCVKKMVDVYEKSLRISKLNQTEGNH